MQIRKKCHFNNSFDVSKVWLSLPHSFLLPGGGFSGIAGWRPSILNQWAETKIKMFIVTTILFMTLHRPVIDKITNSLPLIKDVNNWSTNSSHFSQSQITTVFVDTRLWKTKHPRKRFQNFRLCLACYQHIRLKSTDHSPLAWRRELQKVTLVAVIGGFRSDMSLTRKTDRNFGNVSQVFRFPKLCINETGGNIVLFWLAEWHWNGNGNV